MAGKRDLLPYLIILVIQQVTIWDTVLATADACETMTSCDLYAGIQGHSKLIAGFSYNVKKADNALTQLRAEKMSLTTRVQALEEELKESENDTVLLTNQEAINKLTLQDKELETGINTLSNKLNDLKDEVNVIFLDNIRNNDKNLDDLQLRVTKLNEQVEKLDAVVRNHTENFGLITSPESPELSDSDQRQVLALKSKYNRLEFLVKEIAAACGSDGKGESLDSLGIELETVKSSYDTLQDQVTELQEKCVTQNEHLETMLEELSKRVEELEKKEAEDDQTIPIPKLDSSAVDTEDGSVARVRLSIPP